MRYRLRTLLIVLAIVPPMIGAAGYVTRTLVQAVDNLARKPAPPFPGFSSAPGTDALHDDY